MAGVADKFDKAYEDKPLGEAPVAALQGVGDGDAEKTQAAFNIKTVRDLGTNPGLVLSVTGSRSPPPPHGADGPTPQFHRRLTEIIGQTPGRYRSELRGHDHNAVTSKVTYTIAPSLSNCADWHLLLDDE